jgi:hypothetical protein
MRAQVRDIKKRMRNARREFYLLLGRYRTLNKGILKMATA